MQNVTKELFSDSTNRKLSLSDIPFINGVRFGPIYSDPYTGSNSVPFKLDNICGIVFTISSTLYVVCEKDLKIVWSSISVPSNGNYPFIIRGGLQNLRACSCVYKSKNLLYVALYENSGKNYKIYKISINTSTLKASFSNVHTFTTYAGTVLFAYNSTYAAAVRLPDVTSQPVQIAVIPHAGGTVRVYTPATSVMAPGNWSGISAWADSTYLYYSFLNGSTNSMAIGTLNLSDGTMSTTKMDISNIDSKYLISQTGYSVIQQFDDSTARAAIGTYESSSSGVGNIHICSVKGTAFTNLKTYSTTSRRALGYSSLFVDDNFVRSDNSASSFVIGINQPYMALEVSKQYMGVNSLLYIASNGYYAIKFVGSEQTPEILGVFPLRVSFSNAPIYCNGVLIDSNHILLIGSYMYEVQASTWKYQLFAAIVSGEEKLIYSN